VGTRFPHARHTLAEPVPVTASEATSTDLRWRRGVALLAALTLAGGLTADVRSAPTLDELATLVPGGVAGLWNVLGDGEVGVNPPLWRAVVALGGEPGAQLMLGRVVAAVGLAGAAAVTVATWARRGAVVGPLGLALAVFLALPTHPVVVQHGTIARAYGLAALALAAQLAVGTGRARAVWGVVAVQLHYMAAPVALAVGLVTARTRREVAWAALPALSLLPWMPAVWGTDRHSPGVRPWVEVLQSTLWCDPSSDGAAIRAGALALVAASAAAWSGGRVGGAAGVAAALLALGAAPSWAAPGLVLGVACAGVVAGGPARAAGASVLALALASIAAAPVHDVKPPVALLALPALLALGPALAGALELRRGAPTWWVALVAALPVALWVRGLGPAEARAQREARGWAQDLVAEVRAGRIAGHAPLAVHPVAELRALAFAADGSVTLTPLSAPRCRGMSPCVVVGEVAFVGLQHPGDGAALRAWIQADDGGPVPPSVGEVCVPWSSRLHLRGWECPGGRSP
jgi:hypothetical protein